MEKMQVRALLLYSGGPTTQSEKEAPSRAKWAFSERMAILLGKNQCAPEGGHQQWPYDVICAFSVYPVAQLLWLKPRLEPF